MAASSVPTSKRSAIPQSGGANVNLLEQMISATTLAERLDVSRDTIYAAMDAGQLAYYRIGTCRRIRQSDAEAYIASRRVGSPSSRTLRAL